MRSIPKPNAPPLHFSGSYPTFLGTSDEFFNQNNEKFDVIFIDGLHHYDQCQADAINSLKCLNKNGFIFFHDFIPRNFLLMIGLKVH